MALRDLLVKLGIEVEGKKKLDDTEAAVKRSITAFDRLGNSVQRLGYWMVAGFLMRGIKNMISGQFEAAVALKYHAEALGLTTQELQKYQYAAEQTHVPVQQVAIAMRYFNRTIGEAALGTKSANKTFAAMGINIKDSGGNIRPTSDVLVEFSDKLKKVPSQALRTAYAMRTLGRGGASMLPVLEKGGDELRDIFKDIDELGGGFTDDFIEKGAALDRQLKRLKMAWRSIYVAIATEVIPVVRWFTAKAIDLAKVVIDLAHHTYVFRTALGALASGSLFYGLMRLFKLFGFGTMGIKDLLIAFAKNAVILAFVAAIAILYLAIDDLYTFMKGGDSVIGAFLDKIGGKGLVLKVWYELHDAFNKIEKAVEPILPMIEDLGKKVFLWAVNSIPWIIKWGGTFATHIVGVIDTAITMLRSLASLLGGVMKAGNAYVHGNFSEGDKALDTAFDDIKDMTKSWGERIDQIYKPTVAAFQSIDTAPTTGPMGSDADIVAAPSFSRPGAGGGGQQPINVNITQHVHGGDPDKVKRATADGAKSGIKSAASKNRDTHAAVRAGMPDLGY